MSKPTRPRAIPNLVPFSPSNFFERFFSSGFFLSAAVTRGLEVDLDVVRVLELLEDDAAGRRVPQRLRHPDRPLHPLGGCPRRPLPRWSAWPCDRKLLSAFLDRRARGDACP